MRTAVFYVQALVSHDKLGPIMHTLGCVLQMGWVGIFVWTVWFGPCVHAAELEPDKTISNKTPPLTTNLQWDTFSDTWGATDGLGRTLPNFQQVGPLRPDKFVGMFYFLWLGPHAQGGPFDITRILAQDPGAMQKKNSPLWGPLHAPHHWGESVFGYYLTDDPYVLRKHAQMLADAGVDVVIFDVTNQVTYQTNYLALLRVYAEIRRQGGKTPQVAFLCPFWDPAKVVAELWNDLYRPGLYPELWFRWEGKPLILADPLLLAKGTLGNVKHTTAMAMPPGHTLGQSFEVDQSFVAVSGSFPTWRTTNSALTLTLYRQDRQGERLASKRFESITDNAWLALRFTSPLTAGTYYLEISDPKGSVGWWSHQEDVFAKGQAMADGTNVVGDRTFQIEVQDSHVSRLRDFFTFRKPQPDYFQGPTQSNMWSWLEVYPQHVFRNARGEKEQMSVGVAQNAVNHRLGSMSESGSLGRSYHQGTFVQETHAVLHGYNFAEQWERALAADPQFIFITGWNEWIAGRFDEFNGIKQPVMFVDEFDQERSRDIEPMKGGHGDNYYYQLVSNIRRFKGVRKPPAASPTKTIRLLGGFDQWVEVQPEFRDDRGDTAHRDFPGYNHFTRYVNQWGRNDFVALKVTHDAEWLYFYARTQEPISTTSGPCWMMLLIDSDNNPRTGWEGYDFVLNRLPPDRANAQLEKYVEKWQWQPVTKIEFVTHGHEMHLAIPRAVLRLPPSKGPLRFNFKWADHVPDAIDVKDFLDYGDAAPNGRFQYHFEESVPGYPPE